MQYTCSACQQSVEGDLVTLQEHTDQHVIDLLKLDHPEWVQEDGICQKCVDFYKAELSGTIFKDAACAVRFRKGKRFLNWIKGIFKKEKNRG